MCGVFGLYIPQNSDISINYILKSLDILFRKSETRGKESSGIHIYIPDLRKAWSLKSTEAPSAFINTKKYKSTVLKALHLSYNSHEKKFHSPFIAIAHARLVTNGVATDERNNQPVTYGNINMVHNGIIVNSSDLWSSNSDLTRCSDVDTEICAALLDSYSINNTPERSTQLLFKQIRGAASIAWLSDQTNKLTLATNTGDLYWSTSDSSNNRAFLFASQPTFLPDKISNCSISTISQVLPGHALSVTSNGTHEFIIDGSKSHSETEFFELYEFSHKSHALRTQVSPNSSVVKYPEGLLKYNSDSLRAIKRCTKCILPSTFPFISFDDDGVCNYCNNYVTKYLGKDKNTEFDRFSKQINHFHSIDHSEDVLVPFSGGRDSCYALDLIVNDLGFKPVTFTYDWGMVTDLARRNISRMCSDLGVRNILISADIRKKRRNISSNVSAWLRNPSLGMVPLFMAGDKHFFAIANSLKSELDLKLDLWAANPLENTDFKSGFCGVTPDFDKERLDYLSNFRKFKMASYYLGKFASNPFYLNSSLKDTLSAFASYYFAPRNDCFFMFDHLIWDEQDVNSTIISKYGFELSPDSPSTWRIGDGTAPFYNYIFVTANGFSEFDTFRSNQIREGYMAREDALELVLQENHPREESLRWYLDTINIDYVDAIRKINTLDVHHLHS